MKVGIYTNIYKDRELAVTKKLVSLLSCNEIELAVYHDLQDEFDLPSFDKSNMAQFVDILITIGGDGTILGIVADCAEQRIPILGVNLGKVGFLAEVEVKDLGKVRDVLLGGKYCTEPRTLIETVVGGKTYLALNEIVVSHEALSKILILEVKICEQKLDVYHCDGFIVATPTGSTAYSLSAGGSILNPHTPALSLTPISSHSLHSRPVIISDSETVKIRVCEQLQNDAVIIVDGVAVGQVSSGEVVAIKKSALTAKFLRTSEYNFYNKLLEKLNKWSTTTIDKEAEVW